jgi:hypothetical protein
VTYTELSVLVMLMRVVDDAPSSHCSLAVSRSCRPIASQQLAFLRRLIINTHTGWKTASSAIPAEPTRFISRLFSNFMRQWKMRTRPEESRKVRLALACCSHWRRHLAVCHSSSTNALGFVVVEAPILQINHSMDSNQAFEILWWKALSLSRYELQ